MAYRTKTFAGGGRGGVVAEVLFGSFTQSRFATMVEYLTPVCWLFAWGVLAVSRLIMCGDAFAR